MLLYQSTWDRRLEREELLVLGSFAYSFQNSPLNKSINLHAVLMDTMKLIVTIHENEGRATYFLERHYPRLKWIYYGKDRVQNHLLSIVRRYNYVWTAYGSEWNNGIIAARIQEDTKAPLSICCGPKHFWKPLIKEPWVKIIEPLPPKIP